MSKGVTKTTALPSDRVLRSKSPTVDQQPLQLPDNIVKSPKLVPPLSAPTLPRPSPPDAIGGRFSPLMQEEIDKRQEREHKQEVRDSPETAARLNESQISRGLAGNAVTNQLKYFEESIPTQLPEEIKKPIIDKQEFANAADPEKLTMIMDAINNVGQILSRKLVALQMAMSSEEDGLFPRVRELEQETDDLIDKTDKANNLAEKCAILEEENVQMKGIIAVQDRKITAMSQQLTDLKARSMSKNIVISGLLGDENEEDCKQKTESFIKEKLKKEVAAGDVKVAHRLGPRQPGTRARQMVVKCKPNLRYSIFKYTKNLKGVKNSNDEHYYVEPQLPEKLSAKRKVISNEIRKLKEYNKGKTTEQKVQFEVKSCM